MQFFHTGSSDEFIEDGDDVPCFWRGECFFKSAEINRPSWLIFNFHSRILDVARGSLDLVCTFPVQTGSDVAEISLLAPPESIVRHHRSRLVRRSNEILTRPIPTCHSSPSRVPTLFPYNLHEDFVSSPSGVAPTPDFISSRLMLLIFLPLPFPIILPACILSWLG